MNATSSFTEMSPDVVRRARISTTSSRAASRPPVSANQAAQLARGVNLAQGYLFSPPVPASELDFSIRYPSVKQNMVA
jgi:hypothetical protein